MLLLFVLVTPRSPKVGTGLLLCYLLWAHVRGDLSLYTLLHKRTEGIGLWGLCFSFFFFFFYPRGELKQMGDTEGAGNRTCNNSQALTFSAELFFASYFSSEQFWWVVCTLAHCSWGALQFSLVNLAFSLVWTHCWELLHPLLCWGRGREIKAMCRRDFNHHVAN